MKKVETKRSFTWVALLAACMVAVAACSGGGGGGDDDDDDDDDGTSVVPPGEVRLSIVAAPHAAEEAVFRMKRQGGGGGAPPIVCSQTTLDGAGLGVVSTGGLVTAQTYNRVQLLLNLDGNDTFDEGVDHVFAYGTPLTAGATTGIALTFDHSDYAGTGWVIGTDPTDPPPQWDWQDGLSCPGE